MTRLNGLGWLSVGLLALASSSCSQSRDEVELGQTVLPASAGPTISPNLTPLPERRLYDSYLSSTPLVACTGAVCLVVWKENGIVARLATASGTVLDSLPIALPSSGDPQLCAVSAINGEFLVVWREAGRGLFGFRIRAADGTPVTASPFDLGLGNASAMSLTGGASEYLFVYSTGFPSVRATRIRGSTVVDKPGGIVLPDQVGGDAATSLATPSQYAVMYDHRVTRINAATGAVLGTSANFAAYAEDYYTASVFDGANYIHVWQHGGQLWASRVRASDGVLLDPPDEFNQLPGARSLCTSCTVGGALPLMVGNELVVSGQVPGAVVGVRASTDLVVHGEFSLPIGIQFYGNASAVASGPAGVHASVKSPPVGVQSPGLTPLYLVSVDYAAPANPKVTSGFEVNFRQDTPYGLGVATNGADYLGTYYDREDDSVLATRIDGRTGAPLDSPPLILGSGILVGGFDARRQSIAVASDGRDYFAAWRDYNIFNGIRVTCEGTRGQPIRLFSGTGNSDMPAMANAGSTYAVFWRVVESVQGRRYRASDLAELDSIAITATDSGERATEAPVVAANNGLPEAQRTYLVVWINSDGAVRARRIRAASGSAIQPVTTLGSGASLPLRVGSDGNKFLVGWHDSTGFRALRVDDVTGLAIDSAPFLAAGAVDDARFSWDGFSYVIGSAIEGRLEYRRLRSNGTFIDSSPLVTEPNARLEYYLSNAALDSAPNGRSLLFMNTFNDAWAPPVRGRFVDSELGTGAPVPRSKCAPPADAGTPDSGLKLDAATDHATDGNSGTGGVAGSGGSSGTSGTGGSSGTGGGSDGSGGVADAGIDGNVGAAGQPSGGAAGQSSGGASGQQSGGSGGNSAGSGGSAAATDAAAAAGSSGIPGKTGANPGGEDGGCGCRQSSPRGVTSSLAFGAFAFLLLAWRKRSDRLRRLTRGGASDGLPDCDSGRARSGWPSMRS